MERRKYKILEKKHDIESEATAFARHLRHLDLQPFAGEDTSVGMEYELQVAVDLRLLTGHAHVALVDA